PAPTRNHHDHPRDPDPRCRLARRLPGRPARRGARPGRSHPDPGAAAPDAPGRGAPARLPRHCPPGGPGGTGLDARELLRAPAPSYARPLRASGGRAQTAAVTARLRAKPESKSATLTTFLGDDRGYLPCVSLLDFKLRDGLLLTAACRSIDAGVKLPGNLVE